MWEPDLAGLVPVEQAKIKTISWLKSLPTNTEILWIEKAYQQKLIMSPSEAIDKIRNASKPHSANSIHELFQLNTIPNFKGTWYLVSDLDDDVLASLALLKKQGIEPKVLDFQIKRGMNLSLDSAYCENVLEELYRIKISRNSYKDTWSMPINILVNGKYSGNEWVSFKEREQSKWIQVKLTQSMKKTIQFQLPDDAYHPDNALYLHPITQRKIKIYTPEKNTPKEIEKLIQTFEDRIERVRELKLADVYLWTGSPFSLQEYGEILEQVKQGKQAVIIPDNSSTGIPYTLIQGGKWLRLKQENGDRIDIRGFRLWPFEDLLSKEQTLTQNTLTPKIITLFQYEYDQNRDWQRYLITENDRDFLIKRDLGEGKLWLFTSDFNEGFSELKKSTWLVGVLGPLMLSSNMQTDPVCAFLNEDWISVPQPEKFQNADKITLTRLQQAWTSSLGMNQGHLSFSGIKGEDLPAGWYHIVAEHLKDSVLVALNTRRMEQHPHFLTDEDAVAPVRISIADWMNVSVSSVVQPNSFVYLKWILWFLVILEVLLGVLVLRTNR
jgi:hypothetical protein